VPPPLRRRLRRLGAEPVEASAPAGGACLGAAFLGCCRFADLGWDPDLG